MVRSFVKTHSSGLLSVGAGLGVISTAYLAAVAGYRTAHRLESEDPYMSNKERAYLVWRLYIPPAAAAAVTIVCIASTKHVDARKTLAAQTALAVSQRAYDSYREQVIEAVGPKKDQLFHAKASEQQIQDRPPSGLIAGSGTVLCCEMKTMRYFNSDMETLIRAVNEVNAKMLRHDYATLDDLYYILGLDNTTESGHQGWRAGRLLEMEFDSVIWDGKPALAFRYNYLDVL